MPKYRGAAALIDASAKRAQSQSSADRIAAKAQRVRKAAKKAQSASEQLSSGVLEALDVGEMALLNRINGELPNRNIATIQDATKIGDGVVAARAMIAQDAAAFNLWAQNAMIRNAKIADLSVDKLSAGTFTAGNIILAGGGRIRAGGLWLDNGGLSLPFASSVTTDVTQTDYQVSVREGFSSMWFFRNPALQGATLRAHSTGPYNAALFIGATTGAGKTVEDYGSAGLEFYASSANYSKRGAVEINGVAKFDEPKGFGMRSPDGNTWWLSVNNNGTITTRDAF